MLSLDAMRARLRDTVADYRYAHGLRVSEMAVGLAKRFREDIWRAEVAGLLHDCAKGMDDDPAHTEGLMREAGLVATPVERANLVFFLHPRLSAFVAARDYGVTDSAILDAIARHGWGHPCMTRLDKIIYCADAAEPGRRQAGAYRRLLADSLDEACLCIYRDSLARNLREELTMADEASAVYNALLLGRRGEGA